MNSSVTIRPPGFALSNEDSGKVDSSVRATVIADETLMIAICDGSSDALALLFRRYARLVRTVAMRILRDNSEAEDLLQDVFLFVFRNCSNFDSSKATVRSWIVQMTYHRAIDRKRYLNSRHFYTQLDLDRIVDVFETRSESRADDLEVSVVNATVSALLETLTADQRNTLNLHFFEGLTFNEIAVKLDQSLGNVRNHYYRALDKLREQMFPCKLQSSNGHGKK